MSLVLDCSVTLSWYFEDERTAASLAVLQDVVKESLDCTSMLIPSGFWRIVAMAWTSPVFSPRCHAMFMLQRMLCASRPSLV